MRRALQLFSQEAEALPSSLARAFSAPAAHKGEVQAASQGGIIELRQYTLKPEGFKSWLNITNEFVGLRKELNPHWKGLFTVDTGSCVHKVVHFYTYRDMAHRDEIRVRLAGHKEWQTKYIDPARQFVQHQESKILIEATELHQVSKAPSFKDFVSLPAAKPGAGAPVYEFRSYQLIPGYGTVPKLIQEFKKGLPAKIEADPTGKLVLFGYTDVGMLNNFVELWRYDSAQACINARQASRRVEAWRAAIGAIAPGVQHFETAFLNPAKFSIMQ